MAPLPRRTRVLVLLLTLGLGALLFLWRLGATGLVDETPPLFAASARGMVERGDWLIPHVNGLPRYDKPPLVYWLMGLLHALPGQPRWDPLGTWASALPSAAATVTVMLALADTLLRWPQPPLRPARATPQHGTVQHDSVQREPVQRERVQRTSGLQANGALAPSPRRCQETPTEGTPGWPALTALVAALAFALSPLVLLWGRIPVSDALFSALVALTFLAVWRRLADPRRTWALPWFLLGLAVLTKGPVAVVLLALTLGLFALLQGDGRALLRRLRPLPGLLLTALVALPWYGLALWRDGRAFWDSFIGYHNLQRFTAVVNDHLEPWWYFAPVLLVAALPVTPLLLLGLTRAIGPLVVVRRRGLPWLQARTQVPLPHSLARFSACWLLAILLFFTAAATKLPSYWLPATPAAALLVALVAQVPWGPSPSGSAGPQGADDLPASGRRDAGEPPPAATFAQKTDQDIDPKLDQEMGACRRPDPLRPAAADRTFRIVWWLSLLLAALLASAFALAPLWVPHIFDPEMPTLPAELLASGAMERSAWLWGLAAVLGWLLQARPAPLRLLALQLPLVLWVPSALLPSWTLGDRLRGLPVRQMAAAVSEQARSGEPLAMVGILKPSLHYYSRRVVIYEGIEPEGLVNLADRLRHERRPGMNPGSPAQVPTVLVVIDRTTASAAFWRGLAPRELARSGLYHLWRLERSRLERRAAELKASGHPVTWTRPRPERY